MRFNLDSTSRAKTVAKKLKAVLSARGHPITLGAAQAAVAEVYGYPGWQELSHAVGTEKPSLDDRYVDAATRAARRVHQMAVLSRHFGSDAAQELLDLLHPTDGSTQVAPEDRPGMKWTPFKGGWLTGAHGCLYLLMPPSGAEPRHLIYTCYGKVDPDNLRLGYFHRLDEAMSMAAVEKKIAAYVAASDYGNREPAPPMRRKITMPPGELDDTPWGEGEDEAVFYGPGLIKISTGSHGGFRVDAALVARMPEVLRVMVGEDGYGWYEEDSQRDLVPLGLPQFFSDAERLDARRHVATDYPDVLKILDGRIPETPETLRCAKRGISEEEIEWTMLYRGKPLANGMIPVYTSMSSYWGMKDLSDEDMTRMRMFLVPKADLDAPTFTFDHERYREAPSILSEDEIMEQAKTVDNWDKLRRFSFDQEDRLAD